MQGELPCLTSEGRLILGRPDSLSRAPDGNGGLYSALAEYAAPKHAHEVISTEHQVPMSQQKGKNALDDLAVNRYIIRRRGSHGCRSVSITCIRLQARRARKHGGSRAVHGLRPGCHHVGVGAVRLAPAWTAHVRFSVVREGLLLTAAGAAFWRT